MLFDSKTLLFRSKLNPTFFSPKIYFLSLSSIHYIFTPSCAISVHILLFRFQSCFQPKTFLFIFSPNGTYAHFQPKHYFLSLSQFTFYVLSPKTLLFQCKLYVFRLNYTFLVIKFTFSVQIAQKRYFFSPSFIFSVQNFTFPV